MASGRDVSLPLALAGLALAAVSVLGIVLATRPDAPSPAPLSSASSAPATPSTRPLTTAISNKPIARPVTPLPAQ